MGESDLGAPRLKNRNEDEDDGLGRAWMPRELPYPSPGSATSATARKIRDEIEVAPATKPPRSRHSQVTGVGCQGKDLTQRRRQAETQSEAKNVQLTPCRSLSFPCYPMPKHALLGGGSSTGFLCCDEFAAAQDVKGSLDRAFGEACRFRNVTKAAGHRTPMVARCQSI